MSKLSIVTLEPGHHLDVHTPLRNRSAEVIDFGIGFQKELSNVIETFEGIGNAVGLAAPQVGIMRRFTVINLDKQSGAEHLVLVNPTIISNTSSLKSSKESCLSIPGYRGSVWRREKVEVSYQDQNGISQSLSAKGFLARVILHEIDHLDGILYLDRMKEGDSLEVLDI